VNKQVCFVWNEKDRERISREIRYLGYALRGLPVSVVEGRDGNSEEGDVDKSVKFGVAGLDDVEDLARETGCVLEVANKETINDRYDIVVCRSFRGGVKGVSFVRSIEDGIDESLLYENEYELASKVVFASLDQSAYEYWCGRTVGRESAGGEQLVSVIVSTRNHAKTLRGSLNSLRFQTHSNVEILVVDDASDDGTIDILEAMAEEDARIQVFRSDTRLYLAAALNFLLSSCKGEYVARADTDDYSSPIRIERQVRCLNRRHLVSILGSTMYEVGVTEDVVKVPRHKRRERNFPSPELAKSLLRCSILPAMHGTWLFRRDVIQRLEGYDSDMVWAEDLELSCRFAANERRFGVLGESLYFRVLGASSSVRDEAVRSDMRRKAIESLEGPNVLGDETEEVKARQFAQQQREEGKNQQQREEGKNQEESKTEEEPRVVREPESKVVLHLGNSLDFGGTTTCILDMVRALPDLSHVVVFARDPSPTFADYFREAGARLYVQRPFSESLLELYEPDVVIVNNPTTSNLKDRGEWLTGVPVVSFYHDPTDLFLDRGVVMFNSSQTARRCESYGCKVHELLYPSVDCEVFHPHPSSDKRPCTFGRTSSVNNPKKFPVSFLEIAEAVSGARFLIQGGGKFYSGNSVYRRCEDRVAFLDANVIFDRYVTYYSMFDVFLYHVFPRVEGFGRTVTEAMACGLPVVTDNVGGVKDQVVHGWNGYLCEDKDEFVHCCQLLRDDPDRRKWMGENSRSRAISGFSFDVFRRRVRRILSKVCDL